MIKKAYLLLFKYSKYEYTGSQLYCFWNIKSLNDLIMVMKFTVAVVLLFS